MTRRLEWLAVGCLLAGFILLGTLATPILGALCIAAGTYALLLPRLVDGGDPSTAR